MLAETPPGAIQRAGPQVDLPEASRSSRAATRRSHCIPIDEAPQMVPRRCVARFQGQLAQRKLAFAFDLTGARSTNARHSARSTSSALVVAGAAFDLPEMEQPDHLADRVAELRKICSASRRWLRSCRIAGGQLRKRLQVDLRGDVDTPVQVLAQRTGDGSSICCVWINRPALIRGRHGVPT